MLIIDILFISLLFISLTVIQWRNKEIILIVQI